MYFIINKLVIIFSLLTAYNLLNELAKNKYKNNLNIFTDLIRLIYAVCQSKHENKPYRC